MKRREEVGRDQNVARYPGEKERCETLTGVDFLYIHQLQGVTFIWTEMFFSGKSANWRQEGILC